MSPSQILKISKDSHSIKKPPLSPPGPQSRAQQTRHPVIIYTHSPKVIHTHPRDFMELVQKLTGLSRSPDDGDRSSPPPPPPPASAEEEGRCGKGSFEDAESAVAEENGMLIPSGMGDLQGFAPPFFDPAMSAAASYINAIPSFLPNPAEFLCSATAATPFYGCTNSLIYGGGRGDSCNDIGRRSISPTSTLDGIDEFREY